jgi:hypothetical protein
VIALRRSSPLGKFGSSFMTQEITPAKEGRGMSLARPMIVAKGESLDWVGVVGRLDSGYFSSLSINFTGFPTLLFQFVFLVESSHSNIAMSMGACTVIIIGLNIF